MLFDAGCLIIHGTSTKTIIHSFRPCCKQRIDCVQTHALSYEKLLRPWVPVVTFKHPKGISCLRREFRKRFK